MDKTLLHKTRQKYFKSVYIIRENYADLLFLLNITGLENSNFHLSFS